MFVTVYQIYEIRQHIANEILTLYLLEKITNYAL